MKLATLLQFSKMAALNKATLKSLRNASSNFPSISATGVQNLNTGICEINKGLFSTVDVKKCQYERSMNCKINAHKTSVWVDP